MLDKTVERIGFKADMNPDEHDGQNAMHVQMPENWPHTSVGTTHPLSKPDQKHYEDSSAPCPSCGYLIQPIDITDMFNLDGFGMNVNKYLLRHPHKGQAIKDLKKMVQYAQWMLERAER